MTDNEATFEGKAKALKSYLNDARKNYGDNLIKGIEEIDISKYEEMINDKKKKKNILDLQVGDDGIWHVTGGP